LNGDVVTSPIQQFLVDISPDVDAIYRMTVGDEFTFSPAKRSKVALDRMTWCPFNSQSTVWFKEAFPLMYLPATCSFRMSDIWRSFIAQRIAWVNGWLVSFHAPTMFQHRNSHNLMVDFAQESPGYLGNDHIKKILERMAIKCGQQYLTDNLMNCYTELVINGFFQPIELNYLRKWIEDLGRIGLTS